MNSLPRSRLEKLWSAALLLLAFVFSAFGGIETNGLRFAWLSDTHVGSASGEADLRTAVADINSMPNLAFVVLSGDVTEYGSWEQLKLAHEILSDLRVPVHVIPGNHDTKWSESGATDFARLWGEDRFVFDAAGFRFIGMHQGPVMKMGDGHWAPQDVRWLAQQLDQMKDKAQPIVFITHYPIDAGIDNWYVVLDLLKKRNTQVVLCGHGHANRRMSFEGIRGVMGRSSLRVKSAQGGFNLVEMVAGTMSFSERVTGTSTKQPWNVIQLEDARQVAGTNADPRPDFSINSKFPGVRIPWIYDSGYTVASTPAISHGLATVGDASGTVVGLDLTNGAVKWRFKAGGAVYSSPAVEQNKVVFGCTDGQICALSADDGRLLWKVQTPRPIVASPAISAGVIYSGSSDNTFRALSLETGKLLWEFTGVRGFVEAKPLVCDNHIVFGAWDEYLYALERASGKLAWRWQGEKRSILYSPAACWPVAANGKVFIAAPDRKLTAIALSSGTAVWRTGDYEVRESIGLSADGKRLYARVMSNSVCAFSTEADTAKLLWQANVGFGYDINSAMLQEKDGRVFYGTKNGLVIALDGQTGRIEWQHKIGPALVNTVLPLGANRVLAADFDGRVLLVDASGQ